MTDMQASLGLHQLARLDSNLHQREKYWAYYDAAFANLPEVTVPAPVVQGDVHARHLYTLLLNLEALTINRNEFIDLLKQENIGSGIHFTPTHLHSFYQKEYGYKVGDFPNAEFIGERTISLPFSTKLNEQDLADVAEAVHRVVQRHRR
jgi:dTDP-4-amino-4,6-dideoxygalactose transaminase